MMYTRLIIAISALAFMLNACSSVNDLFYDGRLVKQRNEDSRASEVLKNKSLTSKTVSDIMPLTDANEQTAPFENLSDLATSSDQIDLSTQSNHVDFLRNKNLNTNVLNSRSPTKKLLKEAKTTVGKKNFSYKQARNLLNDDDIDKALIVVICFFIPPLGVYLHEGSWTNRCTLNLILTLLCGLPGLIHALIVVLEK